jgi:autotransporter-associated beta strand protein
LQASAEHAINGGTQFFYDDSALSVEANDALTTKVDLFFDNSWGGVGGTLALNDYSTFVGRVTSESEGSGMIVNNGVANAVLTVDGTELGDSLFSDVMANGNGGGTLGLRKEGSSTLMLTRANTYTGSTVISAGTLLVDGSIASSSMLTVGMGATLGGSGTVDTSHIESGAILAPGSVGTTLTVDGDLTIASMPTRPSPTIPKSTLPVPPCFRAAPSCMWGLMACT